METPITKFPITSEKIAYTKANGTAATIDVPMVEIPAGTLLFRGVQLPNSKKDEDPRLFVRDWLGYPIGDRFCMTPTHNTFFYTTPHVPFGAHTVGEWFNAIMIYQTVRNLRVVAMVGPSKWVRGGKEIKALDGTAPIQRCDKFDYTCLDDPTSAQAVKEKTLKAWDNCIHPDFARSNKVSGWMAIADYDSLDNFKEGLKGKDTTMGKYIIELEARMPGKGVELLCSTYTDASLHRGFPELVLFPWSPHPGTENQYTEARTQEEAADAIAEISNRFNYLPLACITERGILEAFQGDFKAGDLPAFADSVEPGPLSRRKIDFFQAQYLEKLMTQGVMIPGVGVGHLQYDMRTGFYIMDILAGLYQNPYNLEVSNYVDLLLDMRTEEEREKVLEYKIKYRSFDPKKLVTAGQYLDGTIAPRVFIFERPDLLYNQFKELGIRMPSKLIPYIWSATEVYQKNLANRKQANDPRGAEEALRRVAEAKQKIQESLEFIAKAKAERAAKEAARAAKKPKGRTAKQGGAKKNRTRKARMEGDSEPKLVLANYEPQEADPEMESYIQGTMKNLWQTFWTSNSRSS